MNSLEKEAKEFLIGEKGKEYLKYNPEIGAKLNVIVQEKEDLDPSFYASTSKKSKKTDEVILPLSKKHIEKLEMAKSNKLRYEDVANSLKEELWTKEELKKEVKKPLFVKNDEEKEKWLQEHLQNEKMINDFYREMKEKDMSYNEKSFTQPKKEENEDNGLHIPYPEILQPVEALRYNKGKLRYTQLMPEFINGTIRIMEFGAQKYELDNWRKGMPFRSILDSLYRHLNSIWAGEDIDAESGEPHWAHASANLMFLCNLYSNKDLMKRFDNRLKNHT